MGTIAGAFIYNGVPQNGATAKLWLREGLATYTDSTDTVQDNPMAVGAKIMNVTNGALFAVDDIVRVDDEHMKVLQILTNALKVQRAWGRNGRSQRTKHMRKPGR